MPFCWERLILRSDRLELFFAVGLLNSGGNSYPPGLHSLKTFFGQLGELLRAGAGFLGYAEIGEGRCGFFYRFQCGTGRLIGLTAGRFRPLAQDFAKLPLRVELQFGGIADRFFAHALPAGECLGGLRRVHNRLHLRGGARLYQRTARGINSSENEIRHASPPSPVRVAIARASVSAPPRSAQTPVVIRRRYLRVTHDTFITIAALDLL